MKIHSWVFAAAFLALATAAAQTPPTTGAPSVAITVAHLDLGTPGLDDGDCTELETSAPGGGASPLDIRLIGCQGHDAGTLVGDNDTVELGAAATNPALTLKYADANADGRYDPGDYLYLDTAGKGTGLTPSTSATAFSIRLTDAMGRPAGTYVHAGDPDFQAFGTAATPFASASLAWTDPDASVGFTRGDVAYILPNVAPGYPAGSLVPQGSLRVTAAPPPPVQATPSTSPTQSSTSPAPAPTSAPPTESKSTTTTSAAITGGLPTSQTTPSPPPGTGRATLPIPAPSVSLLLTLLGLAATPLAYKRPPGT